MYYSVYYTFFSVCEKKRDKKYAVENLSLMLLEIN